MPNKDLDPRPWEILSSEYLIRRPWLTVRQDRVRLSNGTVIDDFNILEFPDWINVLAVTTDDMIVLVRQYRHGIREVHYELPAGICDSADSSPEETARRELLEETGYGGGEWSLSMTLSANTSNHSNRNYCYLAKGVTLLKEQELEATEEIHVHLASPDEVRDILAVGGVMQALHVAPLLQYLSSLRGR